MTAPSRATTAIMLATGMLTFAACADDSTDHTDAVAADSGSSEADEIQWLYVIDADAAVATDSSLTLTGLDQDAVAFTDRPSRQARRVMVQALVADWDDLGFADDPPNAALAVTADGAQQTYVVELTDPQLDADQLTFSYERIDEPGTPIPATLGPLAVFIDDGEEGLPVGSPGVLGGGTMAPRPPSTSPPDRSDQEGGAPTPNELGGTP